ncbi:MAG: DUF4386 domain-containing protein [Gemmatimonas sp.]
MTPPLIDSSQRKAAKIAGFSCLTSLVFMTIAEFQFGAVMGSAVKYPAETARYVLAHETLIRFGIVGVVLCCVGLLVLSAALYIVLKPVDQNLALLAFSARLFHAISWFLFSLTLVTALRLVDPSAIGGSDDVRAFPADRLPFIARLYLSSYDQIYAGLLFWDLGVMVGSYLWLRSGYIPRALAVFGILTSVWGAACALGLYIVPDFPNRVNVTWYDTPVVLFEVVLSFVLLFRDLQPSRMASGSG